MFAHLQETKTGPALGIRDQQQLAAGTAEYAMTQAFGRWTEIRDFAFVVQAYGPGYVGHDQLDATSLGRQDVAGHRGLPQQTMQTKAQNLRPTGQDRGQALKLRPAQPEAGQPPMGQRLFHRPHHGVTSLARLLGKAAIQATCRRMGKTRRQTQCKKMQGGLGAKLSLQVQLIPKPHVFTWGSIQLGHHFLERHIGPVTGTRGGEEMITLDQRGLAPTVLQGTRLFGGRAPDLLGGLVQARMRDAGPAHLARGDATGTEALNGSRHHLGLDLALPAPGPETHLVLFAQGVDQESAAQNVQVLLQNLTLGVFQCARKTQAGTKAHLLNVALFWLGKTGQKHMLAQHHLLAILEHGALFHLRHAHADQSAAGAFVLGLQFKTVFAGRQGHGEQAVPIRAQVLALGHQLVFGVEETTTHIAFAFRADAHHAALGHQHPTRAGHRQDPVQTGGQKLHAQFQLVTNPQISAAVLGLQSVLASGQLEPL